MQNIALKANQAAKKREPFVQLNLSFVYSKKFSRDAKAVLTYLLSKFDDWHPRPKDIMNHCVDLTRYRWSRVSKELRGLGILELKLMPESVGSKLVFHRHKVAEVTNEPSSSGFSVNRRIRTIPRSDPTYIKTTTRSIINKDPIDISPTPVVVSSNSKPVQATNPNPIKFEGIKKRLELLNIDVSHSELEQHERQQIESVLSVMESRQDIKIPTAFFRSGLKAGYKHTPKTSPEAPRDTNSIISEQNKAKEKECLVDRHTWKFLREIGKGDNLGLFANVRRIFLIEPIEKWPEVEENLKRKILGS